MVDPASMVVAITGAASLIGGWIVQSRGRRDSQEQQAAANLLAEREAQWDQDQRTLGNLRQDYDRVRTERDEALEALATERREHARTRRDCLDHERTYQAAMARQASVIEQLRGAVLDEIAKAAADDELAVPPPTHDERSAPDDSGHDVPEG